MEKKHQVLWIDDQWDKFTGLIERGNRKNIEFTKARTMEEGLKLYKTHLNKWDGVILDGYFFKNSLNGDMNAGALIDSMNEISKLETERYVPYFIFSAYTQELKKVLGNDRKIYDKTTDVTELLDDIIFEANNLTETQIKKEYWDIFEAYPKYQDDLIRILTPIQKKDVKNNEILNTMRTFFEETFVHEFHCIGFSTKIKTLAGLSLHFKNYNKDDIDYKGRKIVPEYIQKTFHNLCIKTNKGSHEQEEVHNGKLPYFIRSAVFDFMNILHWLKELPKDEKSKNLYQSLSEEKMKKEREKQEENTRREEQNGETIEAMINITTNGSCYCIVKNPEMVKAVDQGKIFKINRSQLYEENNEQ